MKNLFNRQIYNFFSGKQYVFLFSGLYALVIGTLFYPGLLYSDSVGRWNMAILLANKGADALVGVTAHHPILPILIMSGFYKITGEVGLFSIAQVFLFALFFIYIVRHFAPNLTGNIIASLALLLPINQVYSVFISYDSLFCVLIAFLFLLLLSVQKARVLLIPLIVALLVGTRINAIVIIPVILIILFLQRASFEKFQFTLTALLCIIFSVLILLLPTILNMRQGTSWLIGTAWEYSNMAKKTNDIRDIKFLESFGVSPKDIQSDICYHGIWCGKELEFINKVGSDRGIELLKNYTLIAINYPTIFWAEKYKYIKSLMGVGYTLQNAEIGRWREQPWKDAMKPLGFETSQKKEDFVNLYLEFSESTAKFIFRPWVVFIMLVIMSLYLKKKERKIMMLTAIPFAYYGSFFITSQNHELRYFFPVAFIFFAYLAACLSVLVNDLLFYLKERNHLRLTKNIN